MQNPGALARDALPQQAAAVLGRLRERSPRVHCITNAVAQNFTANTLLAAGAVPSMTLSAEEIGCFVASADALLVNLGTLDRERRTATAIALTAAAGASIPWLLDPVFVDRSAPRLAFARELMRQRPTAVRLNHAEFAAMCGAEASPEAATAFAQAHGTVVGLSGAADLIADATRRLQVANGHPLMAKVTAMGCAASALSAACLAVEPDPMLATASALLMVGVAGEVAAKTAKGPGSFAVAILDALHSLDERSLIAHAKVS